MKYKLVLFDMDGTLLDGRTINIFAEKKGFQNELINVFKSDKKFYEKTIEIAKLLKGFKKTELIKIFREIPLQKDVEKVIIELKKRKIKTAIITDSYQFVADDLRKRLGIDYIYANNLISKNVYLQERSNSIIINLLGITLIMKYIQSVKAVY